MRGDSSDGWGGRFCSGLARYQDSQVHRPAHVRAVIQPGIMRSNSFSAFAAKFPAFKFLPRH